MVKTMRLTPTRKERVRFLIKQGYSDEAIKYIVETTTKFINEQRKQVNKT
jgi:uncharacterized membrane-anchored protein